MIPIFCAEIPAGAYTLKVKQGASAAINMTVTVPEHCYYIPSNGVSNASTWAATDVKNILTILFTAINTAFPGAATGFDGSDSVRYGNQIILSFSSTDFLIDYVGTTGASKFNLNWIGLTNANHTANAGSGYRINGNITPALTWFPKIEFSENELKGTNSAIFTSDLTADGSFHAVDQTDGTVQYWKVFQDAGLGVLRFKLFSQSLLNSDPDWVLTHLGTPEPSKSNLANEPWISLNGTGGFWLATRGCKRRFLYIRSQSNDAVSETSGWGEYIFNYSGGCPIDMKDWRSFRCFSGGNNAGGRLNITFAALRVAGVGDA